jgi:hypothetical protein
MGGFSPVNYRNLTTIKRRFIAQMQKGSFLESRLILILFNKIVVLVVIWPVELLCFGGS